MVEDYGEAVHIIKAKLADGMFLASQNIERDAIAVFTQPLLINKWSWFMLKESDLDPKSEKFKLQADIGTIKGTNTYQWLKTNGYAVAASPSKASSLVAMLASRRIDAVFLSDVVFENELDEKVLFTLKKFVEIEKHFAMYISHDYVKRHPESIEKINLSIKDLTKE
jgi:ABC-type amino acid transport substrate-binding protein